MAHRRPNRRSPTSHSVPVPERDRTLRRETATGAGMYPLAPVRPQERPDRSRHALSAHVRECAWLRVLRSHGMLRLDPLLGQIFRRAREEKCPARRKERVSKRLRGQGSKRKSNEQCAARLTKGHTGFCRGVERGAKSIDRLARAGRLREGLTFNTLPCATRHCAISTSSPAPSSIHGYRNRGADALRYAARLSGVSSVFGVSSCDVRGHKIEVGRSSPAAALRLVPVPAPSVASALQPQPRVLFLRSAARECGLLR